MKVTDRTKRILHHRRAVRLLLADGFEEVGENGDPIWELHRGYRRGQVIKDVRIAPDGLTVFVKIGAP